MLFSLSLLTRPTFVIVSFSSRPCFSLPDSVSFVPSFVQREEEEEEEDEAKKAG